LGTAYNDYGDETSALKHFKEALNIDIDNTEIILNIA